MQKYLIYICDIKNNYYICIEYLKLTIMNLYERLRDDLKEKLDGEVKEKYPSIYDQIMDDLVPNKYYLDLKYITCSNIYFYCCEPTEFIQLNGACNLFK